MVAVAASLQFYFDEGIFYGFNCIESNSCGLTQANIPLKSMTISP